MQNEKNPNREQKKVLTENNKDWKEWLLVKTYIDSYMFRNKITNETVTLSKKIPGK